MNKRSLLIVLGVVIAIGASMAYVLLRRDDVPMQENKKPQVNTEVPASQAPETQQGVKGSYVDYSDELLTAARGTKLLFFHAPWCPQCRMLDESIKAADLPDGVTIFKVDYDSNQTLRAKYGVTLQTTIVKVDDDGNKLASYVAYDEPTFERVKQALLP